MEEEDGRGEKETAKGNINQNLFIRSLQDASSAACSVDQHPQASGTAPYHVHAACLQEQLQQGRGDERHPHT